MKLLVNGKKSELQKSYTFNWIIFVDVDLPCFFILLKQLGEAQDSLSSFIGKRNV